MNAAYRPLIVAGLIVAATAPATAQTSSPFQSEPGPEPAITRPPKPVPQPPRRAYHRPRPTVSQPAATPQPTVPVPAVVAPQPPPPPAEPSLAGTWIADTNCPLGKKNVRIVTPTGGGQYRIVAPESSYSGWISGKVEHGEATGLFGDRVTENGTVTSPTTMSGKVHLGYAGIDCDWWAKKE